MKITFTDFLGTAPKFHPEQLSSGYSTTADNTRVERGMLEAWRVPKVESTAPSTRIKSIFKYLTKWFTWEKETSCVRVPLVNDPFDLVVFAGEHIDPQITANDKAETGAAPYPTLTYSLGVPVPDAPISGVGAVNPNRPAAAKDNEADWDAYNVTYIVVYRDAWGRFSAPSVASPEILWKEWDGQEVWQITLTLPPFPKGALNSDRGQTGSYLIYRASYNGSGGGAHLYCGEVSAATANVTYVDKKLGFLLDEEPQTYGWNPPPNLDKAQFPNGSMHHVCAVSTNFLAGCNTKLVCFAEPGTAYAWPVDYYQIFREEVVTIAAAGSNLVVLTESYPYVLSGVHPSSMSQTRLADPVGCLSRSTTEIDDRVFFAGSEGLYAIHGFTIENITEAYLTPEQWQALDPRTIKLSNFESTVFIHSTATGQTFTFWTTNPKDGLRKVGINPQAIFQLESSGDLAFIESGSNEIKLFHQGTARMPTLWVSKVEQFNEPAWFAIGKVRAETYPLDFTLVQVKADGSEFKVKVTVLNDRFFYLPVQQRGIKWSVEIRGAEVNKIRSIELAQDVMELQ